MTCATVHRSLLPRSATRWPRCPRCTRGWAIFVAWYGIRRLRTGLRWLLLLYPLAMSFVVVYYAEHYVVDIIAGGLCVAVGDDRLD